MKSKIVFLLSFVAFLSGCTHVHHINMQKSLVQTSEDGTPIQLETESSIIHKTDYELWFKMGAHTHNLSADTTVLELTRNAIIETLSNKGLKAVATETDNHIGATLKQFNIDNHAAMWSFSFQTKIGVEFDMVIDGQEHKFFVKGWGKNVCQYASPENFELSIQRAIDDFKANLIQELSNRGL